MVGRLINFLLVPVITSTIDAASFAPYVELYAYAGVLLVILSFGMETAFFRFVQKHHDPATVLTTASRAVLISTGIFLVGMVLFRNSIAQFIGYPQHSEYVVWFGLILTLDLNSNVLLAWLRYRERAIKFATIRFVSVLVTVGLTFYWLKIGMERAEAGMETFAFDASIGIGYAFVANLVGSALAFILLLPIAKQWGKGRFDKVLFKKMLAYSWPLVLVGLGGILNEMLDRIVLRHLLVSNRIDFEIGVYGAFYKLSIIMSIFIQAFRYAAEPFFFSRSDNTEGRKVYADVLFYFILVCGSIFLITSLFAEDIAKIFIRDSTYFDHPDALLIVPILLMANLFLGVYHNVNIWYKVTNHTRIGAALALTGAVFTITFLVLFTPQYGFLACAWTTLFVYLFLAVSNLVVGRRYFPVPYSWHIPAVIVLAAFCFVLTHPMLEAGWNPWVVKLGMIAAFLSGAGLLSLHYKKL